MRGRLSATAACLLIGMLPMPAEAAAKVIELFTSQGCSSCPPADRLAAILAKEPGTVLISLPVDYWDYLGWKDSFARHAFTARQKAYAKARGDMQVYTPQAVINGVAHAVGSERDAIEAQAGAHPEQGVVVTEREGGGALHVDIGAASGGARSAQVWLVPVLAAPAVAIGRGENAGATITYTNVARGMVKLGDWNGQASTFDVPLAQIRDAGADSAAVLVQVDAGGLPGPILGAAIVKLK